MKSKKTSTKKPKLGSGKRFAAMTDKLEQRGMSASGAKAVAASIGRKKYGNAKMASMAAAGKKRAAKKKK